MEPTFSKYAFCAFFGTERWLRARCEHMKSQYLIIFLERGIPALDKLTPRSRICIPVACLSNPQSLITTTSGSGFVYDNQGHVVTNGHVVGGATIVDVTFPDGNRYAANVIANDIYSDIAVLQISQNVSKSLKPLVLGNSSEVGVGDTVIAIGTFV